MKLSLLDKVLLQIAVNFIRAGRSKLKNYMTQEKFTISLDWLELRFSTLYFINSMFLADADANDEAHLNFEAGFSLIPCYNKIHLRSNYKNCLEISYGNKSVGYLYHTPRSTTFLNPEDIIVKINNAFLYNDDFARFYEVFLKRFEFDFEDGRIIRLDIALDSNVNELESFEKLINTEGYRLSKKIRYEKKMQPYKCTQIGAFISYNKSSEIKKSEKVYIRDYHKRNGLNPDKVYRTELRLLTEDFKKLGQEGNIVRLSDPKYLLSIFKYFSDKYLYVRQARGTNKARDPKIHMLNLTDEMNIEVKKNDTSNIGFSVTQAKTYLKHTFWNHLSSPHILPLDFVMSLADTFTLFDWFTGKQSSLLKEYNKIMGGLFYIPTFDTKILEQTI